MQQPLERGEAGPGAVRTGRIVVFYAHQKGIVGGFKFRKPPQWFDLA